MDAGRFHGSALDRADLRDPGRDLAGPGRMAFAFGRSDQFWAWAAPVAFGLFAALEVYLGITEPVVWVW